MNKQKKWNQLPEHARLIASDEVWMESEAADQLERAARLPGCVRAVGMPDLHSGPGGMPVGVALAFADCIRPGLLGSDTGCGALLVIVKSKQPSLDPLERRVRAAFQEEELVWHEESRMVEAILSRGLPGLADLETLPESLRRLAVMQPVEEKIDPASLPPASVSPLLSYALGSIGGGNHFGEVASIAKMEDRDQGQRWGIARGQLAVLVHSGARSVGKHIFERFGNVVLVRKENPKEFNEYRIAHEWTCRFARANRFLIAWRLLCAAQVARPDKIVQMVDCIHNQVVPYDWSSLGLPEQEEVWLHRKGAAPALRDQLTVILGSRGAPSFLMLGSGNEQGLASVAHGAGRRMTRSDAFAKMRFKHRRESLVRTELGSRVICDRSELLYEEHPEVYKAIEPVLDSVVSAKLAVPVAALHPLITVKQ